MPATASRKISKDPFLLSTTLIIRLCRPCGARIATIATVATRIATFANHGFIALRHCPRDIACPANVRVDRAARFHAIPMYRVHARFDAKHPDSSRLRSNPDMSALDNIGADHNDALAKSLTEVSCTENLFSVSRISMTSPRE